MGFSLTLRPALRVSQQLLPRLTTQQRIVLREVTLTLRQALHESLHDGDYQPHANCPQCRYRMKQIEILKGFRSDPRDFTTECPKCKYRFEARLIRPLGLQSQAELRYYCPEQTLDQLKGSENLPPAELSETSPALYHSAILHFGTIKKAFEKLGVNYHFEEIFNWQEKVSSFLGKLPDTTIASCVGVPTKEVRTLRRKNRIEAHNARRTIREASRE